MAAWRPEGPRMRPADPPVWPLIVAAAVAWLSVFALMQLVS